MYINEDYNIAIQKFESALSKQEKNITETGEDISTKDVRIYFNKLKQGDTAKKTIKTIQNEMQTILYSEYACD